ncbi:MAG: hypothetical protein A2Y62_20440 [Candidatus Fischerbacteria bacterium RBG_13_37_8]|uniref:Uncharacterized protein n=1 Tax=Candidatus Fischerbacteria bacterium RBG_13_37_8 TaxID=1817863 RepID=A0A1F5VY91_9BACT|nr:MAG: hypothetical protein A2Y62_20440 [Candidatus Fischerbacteria bacterium RBG_13_37_8]
MIEMTLTLSLPMLVTMVSMSEVVVMTVILGFVSAGKSGVRVINKNRMRKGSVVVESFVEFVGFVVFMFVSFMLFIVHQGLLRRFAPRNDSMSVRDCYPCLRQAHNDNMIFFVFFVPFVVIFLN